MTKEKYASREKDKRKLDLKLMCNIAETNRYKHEDIDM
jgi:hypothetical protein